MTDARAKRFTLIAAILGSAIVFVDSTVVNVALPALRADLDAGLATQQWVVEAYLLTLGSLVLIGGSLGDLFGRRLIFIVGVAGFGASSLLCGISPSSGVLIAARALQGIAGALLVPSSLALITSTFEGTERAAAIGSWTAWTSAAIAVGPTGGGALVDATSWRVIFLLNVPMVLAALYLAVRHVPESAAAEGRSVDWRGGVLATLGLGGPVLALIEQPTHGWTDPLVLVPLVAGLALLAAFVAYQRRARDPMLPLRLFASRNFAAGNIATFSIYAGLSVSTFFLAIFLQQVGGYSALDAGLALTPVTLILLTLSRRFGALADRLGSRAFMTAGPIVAGVGFLMFIRMEVRVDYLGTVLPAVIVFGLGLALTVAPLTATVLGAVSSADAGIASGVNNAVARVAGLVAIAAVGTIISAQFASTADDRLAGRSLGPGARAAVADAKTRPLGGTSLEHVEPQQHGAVARALDDATVHGFRVGMAVSAVLAIGGGLISAVGIRNARPGPAGPAEA